MSDPGYLVSKAALDRFNATASAVRNRLAPSLPAYIGQPERQRFLMKVTGKYAGGGIYSALADVAYEGYAVVQDGDAGDFVAVSGGPTWGGTSVDWPPVVDILAVNYSKHGNAAHLAITTGAVVEVFQLGNDEFSACWYCIGQDHTDYFWNRTFVGYITANGTGGSYTVRRLKIDGSSYSPTFDVTATEINGMDDIPLNTRVMVLTDGTTYRIWAGSGYMGGTPVDKSYSGEHQEAARTGVGFTRGASGFDTTFKFSVVVGEAYYDDTDEIWYEYRQDATIDSMGRVKLIDGTETRVTVETPELCS